MFCKSKRIKELEEKIKSLQEEKFISEKVEQRYVLSVIFRSLATLGWKKHDSKPHNSRSDEFNIYIKDGILIYQQEEDYTVIHLELGDLHISCPANLSSVRWAIESLKRAKK
jgi:hypothetical protein